MATAGRPTKYTPELMRSIVDGLSEGQPLAVICRREGYPHPSTVRDWMAADEEISRDIARGRELGWDEIAHRARLTARGEGDSKQDVQRDKLIIETDLKLLAKWDKRYGDKVTQEISGPDGGPVEFRGTESELDAKILALNRQLGYLKEEGK